MHTSLYPSEHKAIEAETKIHDDIETMAETLEKAGYYTIGIVSHTFVDKEHGFAQGFQVFDESQIMNHDAVTSEALTGLAMKYMKKGRRKPKPFFLWIHYFDPHFTYVRHPDFGFAGGNPGKLPENISAEYLSRLVEEQAQLSDKDIEFIKAIYDEEIAYTDRWIGTLLSHLKSLQLERSTTIVLTADHGEYFLERGKFFHGKDVYNELVHVPLIIAGAINDTLHGAVVERPVEIASIPKTIMELVGIEEHRFSGENLIELAGSHQDTGLVFTEGNYAWGQDQRKKAVLFKNWKLIYNIDDDTYELYDMDADRDEQYSLWDDTGSSEITKIKSFLKKELTQFPPKKPPPSSKVELSEETRKHLRSLGYVQ
ncbi:MAG: sulfatase-like hydrolase/transferase [bacterium]|nr:sulfatase-like hydrolase/transferase [bacterium]